MAWAGTGMLWTMSGGVPKSGLLGARPPKNGDLFFVQISDSHIGFNKAANADVTATMQAAIAKINALPTAPAFLLHTGDISQLAKASEFDTADQVLRDSRTKDVFFVPGEHDVGTDNGRSYLERYGKKAQRAGGTGGWYSFDHSGVHFIGLVNVFNLKAGGLGALGAEQLEWLEKDVKHLVASTPIVVFAHVPLWSVYPAWGWGTDDGARALSYLKKFGSVTVLNGHIHQTMQKVEGNVTFHTALSTAFPQPRPGTAPAPGPMVVPANQLRDVLGITQVKYLAQHRHLGDRRRESVGRLARSGDGGGRSRGARGSAECGLGCGHHARQTGRRHDHEFRLHAAEHSDCSGRSCVVDQRRRCPAPHSERELRVHAVVGARHEGVVRRGTHASPASTSTSALCTRP